jgi:predicted ATP-binding protein involved in virulence
MQVKRLQINAFRGIETLDLEFRPGANVFIGVNGIGKSSILECLAAIALMYTDGFRSTHIIPFSDEEVIKLGHDRAHTTLLCQIHQADVGWTISYGKTDVVNPGNDLSQLSLALAAESQHLASPETSSFGNSPIGVYYPSQRLIPGEPFSPRRKFLDIRRFDRQLDFTEFFTWFKEREDLENETRLETNPDHRDRQLEAIRQAIPIFLPGFSHLRIKRSPLRMVVTKNGQELIISQLSDGEKSLLTIIGDIARRLAICNPALDNPLEGEGIILIDEIDAHLHPKWQRGIIPKLEHTFPNCQFFIATHSPQIISDVRSENIYLLKQDDDGEVIAIHPEGTYGRDTNRILEDVMGVPERPEWTKQELRQLFRLIDSGDLPAARNLKNQLGSSIGIDEPEFAKADVLIRRKER